MVVVIPDNRSRRIILLAHCLLNQNSIVWGLAQRPAIVKELVDLLHEYRVGIIQLPCPETLHSGLRRWWQVKEQYDTPGFREHARSLIAPIIDYLLEYKRNNFNIIGIIGVSGSPSCGVHYTSSSVEWLGDPRKAGESKRVEGRGVFMEILLEELESRGIKLPLLLEYDYDKPEESLKEIREALVEYLQNKVSA